MQIRTLLWISREVFSRAVIICQYWFYLSGGGGGGGGGKGRLSFLTVRMVGGRNEGVELGMPNSLPSTL